MPAPRRLLTCLALCVLLAAALPVAACRQNPPQPPRAARAQPGSTLDAGAPVLAATLNARAAIAAGDPIAAFNDVNLGYGYAVRLAGADSALYPPPVAPPGYQDHSAGQGGYGGGGGGGGRGAGGGHHHRGGPGAPSSNAAPAAAPAPAQEAAAAPATPAPTAAQGGHGGHHGRADGGHAGQLGQPSQVAAAGAGAAPFTSFDAQVRLISAQAKLQARDAAGADADLQVIEAAVHPQLTPVELPLIRAGQSLTLASAAVSGGRLSELRTQLVAAQAALDAYQGAPHAREAKALAHEIGRAIQRPDGPAALPPAQIALWAGLVGAWISAGI